MATIIIAKLIYHQVPFKVGVPNKSERPKKSQKPKNKLSIKRFPLYSDKYDLSKKNVAITEIM